MQATRTVEEAIDRLRLASRTIPPNQELIIHEGNSRPIDQCARWVFAAKGYDGDLNRGILLRGPKGTGKTHLMRCISYLLTPYGFMPKKCDDIVKEFNDSTKYSVRDRSGFETRTIGGDQVIDKYAAMPRICFDDLCDERQGKYFGEECNVMERILSKRGDLMASQAMLTMFTTNVEPDDVETKYGPRVRDRMSLMARAFTVMPDPDPQAKPFRTTANVMPWRKPVEEPRKGSPERSAIALKLIEELANSKNEATKIRLQEEQEGKSRYLAGFIGRARQMSLTELMHAATIEPYGEARQIARQEFDRRAPVTLDELQKQAAEKVAERNATDAA